ncbi:hypothetical protein SEA_DAUBENSKI_206 [Streptomyces phage Daubenski]|uniref:Uncharacterized protein n=1 Tax=Streptomyces phage Daubenski TaxID=2653725 RepID=A0A5Q2WHX2_9CAUD|nr:hypothetical protein KNU80_gp098 [Streptomyces phage Daubenski]QGH76474.1 hypothetical protein SEA_DAUBENSKI_206 [Streptomyces phage Daubenski]
MRTRQRNLGRCGCGRPILIGHLRKYNGNDTKLCPACNAEQMIEEIRNRGSQQDREGLDSSSSARYDG